MKRAAIGTFCTILLLLMVFGPGMETRGQDVPPSKTTLIVKLAAGVTLGEGQAAIERHGGTLKSSIGPLRMLVIEVPTDSAPTIMAELREDPAVERVEEDRSRKLSSIPSDALYASQWALTRIAWNEVYGTATFTGQVDVAVLDTGIDASHPDLIGAIGPGTSFLDDSDGRTDLNGHGTWVSGIVAGRTNNLDGIAGVGYSNVQILPVKVLNAAGEGQDSDIISGILWAVDHHASVILMAFSNPGFSQNLQDAIDYAWDEGTVLVAAAGNDGSNAGTFPAGDKSVIGVSATDENDDLATGSNYGPSIFMAAPGTNIVSTYKDGAYVSWSGTSASAAMVAGAAALIRASDPTLSNGAVVGRLARNADPAGTQEETGNGRLQIVRALADTATDEVRPAGSPPVGDGGPFVGPYRAAARNSILTFAGTGGGTVLITTSAGTVEAPVSCGGTGSPAASQTVSSTCSPNITTSSNGATITFTATANGVSTFASWSGQSDLTPVSPSTSCSNVTNPNPCSAILGSNAKLTVTFNGNPAPTAAGQTLSTGEDTALPITLAGTDTAPAALTFSIVSGPSPTSGTLGSIGAPSCAAGSCTAAVTFTPTANYNGPASFTFKTNDGSQDSPAATVNITVTPVNDTPTAADTTLSGAEDAGDILINFGPLVSDLETLDANLTYQIVSPPSSGSLTGAGQHRSFTPASNFVGSVTFTYKVTDRGDPDNCIPVGTTCAAVLSSAVKTVTIDISPINDKPTANDLTTANVPEDSAAGVSFDLGTLVSDVETSDANLIYTIVSGPTAAQGTLTGTLPSQTFAPAANFNGTVSITYKVTDRGDPDNCGAPNAACAAPLDSDTKAITIVVTPLNDAPVATAGTFSGTEDGAAVAIDLGTLVSDVETSDALLTYAIVDGPAAAQGILSGSGQNRSFAPAANFNGPATFTFKVTDRGDPDNCTPVGPTCTAPLISDVRTVTINISTVNDKPTANNFTTANIAEDSVAGVSFDLSAHVSDIETDDAFLTYHIVSGPTPAQGALTGTLPNQTFVPAANFNGTVSITYDVTDRGDPDNCTPGPSCSAALTSDTKTITIVVTPVNDAPVAIDGPFSGPEDGGAIAIDLGTLASDLETDDANLAYEIVTPPASGSLSGAGQNRTFTPAPNFNGQVTFTYKVTDRGDPDNCSADPCAAALDSGTKTVTITITPVNDKPVANNLTTASVAEDSATGVSFDLLALVSDVETGDADLTYSISGPTAAQGTLTGPLSHKTFVPAANFNGTVLITYDVTDRGDPDNCTPGPSCSAAQTSDTRTITIVVTPVNDAPVAINGTASGTEDGGAIAINLGTLASDLETDDANLNYEIVTPPASGSLSGAGQSQTFTPVANFNGQVTFTYKVTDRGDPDNCGTLSTTCAAALDSDIKTVTITIAPVNDQPVANNLTPDSIAEDSGSVVAFDLSTLVSDVETSDANLSYNIVSGPTAEQGTLTGTLPNQTFTPAANFNGTVLITYNVTDRGDPDGCSSGPCDAAQTSDTKTITIVVTPVNDRPVAYNGSFSGVEDDGAVLIDLGDLVSDVETGDANLTYTITDGPTAWQGTLTGGQNPSFTPAANFNGVVTFKYKVTDRGDPDNCLAVPCAAVLDSDTKTVTITITPVNDKPVANNLTTASIPEDSAVGVAFDLSTLVSDVETADADLTYTIVSGPAAAQGTLTGTLPNKTFVPAANFNGTVLISYKVTDRGDPDNCSAAPCAAILDSDTKTITIVVTPVNDIPYATDGAFTGDEDVNIPINLRGLVSDLETSDPNLTYTIMSGPSSGTLTPGASAGYYTYLGAPNFFGDVEFTYEVTDRGDPDNCGAVGTSCAAATISETKTVTIHVLPVNDAPGVTASSAAASAQYSDPPAPAMKITVVDVDTAGIGLTLTSIQVNGGNASGLTASVTNTWSNSREWTIGGQALLAPGTYTVRVNVSDGFLSGWVEFTLTVTKEDADITYSGVVFFSTSSISSNTGTATFSATITDENDGADTRGDIRNAKVTFVNRENANTPFPGCSNLPVGLANPGDLKVGTATCQTVLTTGSGDSDTYMVGIIVNNHYTRDNPYDDELVTIYKPIGTYFITGGGHLVLTNPAGAYAGDVGSKNNFGYNVKYNKTGKNLQGNFNSIVRKNGRVYQIKATAMTSLNVNPPAGCPNATVAAPCSAVFTSKANMTDITDPLHTMGLAGSLVLQVTITDKGQPGNADSIGISVFDQNGGLLFSSKWNGATTVEQPLTGGNQVVH